MLLLLIAYQGTRLMSPIELLKSEFTRWRLSNTPNYTPHTVQHIERVTVADLCNVSCQQLHGWGFKNWDGQNMLVPLWALDLLRPGEELICIDGRSVKVGYDDTIDTDTRGGCIAYGFPHPALKKIANVA